MNSGTLSAVEMSQERVLSQSLTLAPLSPAYSQQLSKLSVAPEQLKFVGTMEEILCCVTPSVEPHVIVVDEQVIGLFLIDTRYSEEYRFCQAQALGFRAFFIDQQFQGRGYVKQAMQALKDYLQSHYTEFSQVYLTVNCKNLAAYQLYRKVGFNDSGELYYGGAAGPQHILSLQW